ncbi:MAG: arginine--tRNA ligase [Firmicutes bacterium]|nr:arginine--tRNA ligase [Bacillota bacterium]
MTIREQIEKDLSATFKKLKFDYSLAQLSPSSIAGTDYQCNASFQIAKSAGLNPFDVATKIATEFKSTIAKCEAVRPAFLNFYINDSALKDMAENVLSNGKISLAKQEKRTIMFDYGAPNIGKELHVGHLRSPIIGEALKRVFATFGHKTISDNYLGDWGTPLGLIMAELELQGKIKSGILQCEVTLDLLNEVYPMASKRKTEDEKFKKKAEDITAKMQNFEQPYYRLWQQIREVSVTRIRENYDKLNCTFDTYNGESYAQPYVKVVLDILKKAGLVYVDKDCLMINVAEAGEHIPLPQKDGEPQRFEKPMPPVILQKGNGGDLYATSDVATIYYRYKDYKPDEYIYVVDERQSLHFTQLFRIVKKVNIVPVDTKLVHVGFGKILGQDGKPFKTRAGGTIRLEEIVNLVTDSAKKRLQENGKTNSIEVAEKIGLAALKFADLSNNVRKDYVFDIDKFTDFNGKTGPYLLYTVARINSILEKATTINSIITGEFDQTIRNIFINIIKISDAFTSATQNYTLNGIVDAVYNLAAEFNTFYGNTNILKEQDKDKQKFYLGICHLVKVCIEFTLDKLGIDTVQSM